MARTGTFENFYFDPEVFTEYMQEQPTIKTALIASGAYVEDASIASILGTKGNVGTMPFYLEVDAGDSPALNYDGNTDNAPVTLKAGKQTFMAMGRMKSWTDKDFTRELSGARPLQDIANKTVSYYNQVWQNSILSILGGIMGVSGLSDHITDIGASSSVTSANVATPGTFIDARTKAWGDSALDVNGAIIMHSMVYASLAKQNAFEMNVYTIPGVAEKVIQIPTIDGKAVLQDDGVPVSTASGISTYTTYILGAGSLIGCDCNVENPYTYQYDAKTAGGTNVLYTKQRKVIHPDGMSLDVGSITAESPTDTELATAAKWSIATNGKAKNVRIAAIKSNVLL